jgi:hypothetical protein
MNTKEFFELIQMKDGKYYSPKPAIHVSMADAAKLLGMSVKTVWRHTKTGVIKTTHTGRVTIGYLVEYLNLTI